MDGNVTITKKEYLRLLIASKELSILNEAGVDNWQGYGEGFEDWDETQEEIKKAVEKM